MHYHDYTRLDLVQIALIYAFLATLAMIGAVKAIGIGSRLYETLRAKRYYSDISWRYAWIIAKG